ncbi:helix-hairpin-helix domain-containing protein [Arcanobacterium pinnipediorum]|uniref:Helix-hairpin-helix domain-containing protein n=1 Tax=Arcanobacterium pinnipediorum TaxID=1503041 RepID=A0ABY5AFB6_9ACTO|nr:helix-hairpin-helix domain-containing protein [Arcanobacterium pinnipediorum]USR78757.1 helix-hairpin-helix domain-containing protein [Arcanobacterium pinnipediorum]
MTQPLPRNSQHFHLGKLRRSPRTRLGYSDTFSQSGQVSTPQSPNRQRTLAKAALAMGAGDDVSALALQGRRSRFLLDSDAGRIVAIILVILCIVVVTRTFVYASHTEISSASAISETKSASSLGGLEQPIGDEAPENTVPVPKNNSLVDPGQVTVYLTGAVHKPGVYTLPSKSRVNDVVTAGGGLTDSADTRYINLAALISDGEHVHIKDEGESADEVASPDAHQAQEQTMVDINSASQLTLESLPGIGPATASAIIKWREEHGRFPSVDSLTDVPGIGVKTLDRLREYIRAD